VSGPALSGGLVEPGDWVKHMPRAPERSSAGLDWPHLQAYRFLNPPSRGLYLPPLASHFIVAHLSTPCDVRTRWSGTARACRSIPGNLMIMSAGQDSFWDWTVELDELHLFLDPALLARLAAEIDARPVELIEGIGLMDPTLSELALKISAEIERPDLCTRLYADSLAQLLALQLLRAHSNVRRAPVLERIDLPAHTVRLALEHIEAHLEQDLSLESLAAAVGVSPFRFARGFRQATGTPPHRYLTLRRLERAKELLQAGGLGIAEIAAAVGFATQSHFTTLFRRHCGITPKRYRDGCRRR